MKYLIRFFLLLSAFHSYSQNVEFSPVTVDPSLLENADSVVREERITYDITDPKILIEKVYKVVSVYNKSGNGDVGAYVFYDDDRKIKDIRATIYDMMGNEKEVFKERDFKDVSAVSGGTLYADDRVLVFEYTPTAYPYTVVFEYETKSRTTAFIPRWIPVANYGSSTAHATLEILYPEEESIHIKQERLEEFDVSHKHEPGKDVWEAQNIKAVKKEYLSPSFDKILPVVKCALHSFYLKGVQGNASSWENFGAWMNDNLIRGTEALPVETVRMVQNMVKDLPTDTDKAKAIYQFVQDKVRYISVQVGIGGWKPMLAADVDHLGYGDCKALSNYTKSLLNAVGVPSYYTVLYGDTEKRSIDKDFIAMQGNHVILALPLDDQYTWLECTSQTVPFGYLGDFTDDRDVLVITEEGGQLKHTKKYDKEDNIARIAATFNLDLQGGFEGKLQKTSEGVFYGDQLGLQRYDDKALKKYYLNEWGRVNRLEIVAVDLENDRDAILFTEDLKLKAQAYLTAINTDFLFKPNVFGMDPKDIPARYDNRKTPFDIDRGQQDKIQLSFNLPEGCSVDALPQPIIINAPFGSYEAHFSVEGSYLNYTRTLSLDEGHYAAAAYDAYRDFYKEVVRADAQKVLIKTKS